MRIGARNLQTRATVRTIVFQSDEDDNSANANRVISDKVDLTETAVDNAEERGPLGHIALAEKSLARNDEEIPQNWRIGKPVLCVPALGILDEAFAAIVAQAVERQGIAVRTEARDALSVSRVFTLDTSEVELLCVCYLATVTPAQIRYSVRRLRRKVLDKFILVTMAGAVDVDEKSLFPSGEQGRLVQGSLTETVMTISSIAAASKALEETASSQGPRETSREHLNARIASVEI
jgi:hypothetical protein